MNHDTSTSRVEVEAVEVTRRFLDALAASDMATAVELLDDDVVYTNVGLPPMHGARAVERFFARFLGRGEFEYVNHHIAVDVDDDGVVLTERTDALIFGAVHCQLWVNGRFEVRDGRITVWRDCFDYVDFTIGALRGLLGALVPGAARTMPTA